MVAGRCDSSSSKIVLPFCLLLLMISLLSSAQASATSIVEVKPSTSSADVGEMFIVNVTVTDVENLYGVQVALHWDSSVLRVAEVDVRVGLSDGVLYSPCVTAQNELNQEKGEYLYAVRSASPAPSFNGSGNIVRITFNASSFGNSTLDLEAGLYDLPPPDRWPPASLEISHLTIDGSFTAIPEFPNEIILPLFMILTLFVVILFTRRTGGKSSNRAS